MLHFDTENPCASRPLNAHLSPHSEFFFLVPCFWAFWASALLTSHRNQFSDLPKLAQAPSLPSSCILQVKLKCVACWGQNWNIFKSKAIHVAPNHLYLKSYWNTTHTHAHTLKVKLIDLMFGCRLEGKAKNEESLTVYPPDDRCINWMKIHATC